MTSVNEWQKRFCEGRTSLQDDSLPGQARRGITPDVIERIDGLIRENRRITQEQIRVQVGINHGSMHSIIKHHLQFRKICAQWVPHQLTEGQAIDRIAACLSRLQRYQEEKHEFLSRIMTGNETWCHHFEPEIKRLPTMETSQFSPAKEIQSCPYEYRYIMLTFFFNCMGPLLVNFQQRGATINAMRYADTLQNLRRAIKSKRPGMLSDGIILLHVNARLYTANLVRDKLQRFGWKTLTSSVHPRSFHL